MKKRTNKQIKVYKQTLVVSKLPAGTKLTLAKRKQMHRLRSVGHTIRGIAAELGCSHTAVWRALRTDARQAIQVAELEKRRRIAKTERRYISSYWNRANQA